MKVRFTTALYYADDMQKGIDAGLNAFGAQLFAESLEKKPADVQEGGVTIRVHDHRGKYWYVTATTREPELLPGEGERLEELLAGPTVEGHPMFLSHDDAIQKVIDLENELAQALITIKGLRKSSGVAKVDEG